MAFFFPDEPGVPEGPQWLAELFAGETKAVGITYSLTSLCEYNLVIFNKNNLTLSTR